ncbi:hypothetical protein [Vulcanisaeta souniana]|uniref:hypothetical protein n=1 Tax=Vulcanisaeta souniana TaxID=164452 RepID=UPI0006CFB88D|nr:hypothetical protein [Vulcanisaeta souniana]
MPSRGELSPLVSVIIAAVLIVVGVTLIMLFYHGAKSMSQRALNAPEAEASGSISASTGVVTINIYNAGATQLAISGVKIYGSDGTVLNCSWNGIGTIVAAGGSYGIVGQCSGVGGAGDTYTIVVTLNGTSGSLAESLTVTAS